MRATTAARNHRANTRFIYIHCMQYIHICMHNEVYIYSTLLNTPTSASRSRIARVAQSHNNLPQVYIYVYLVVEILDILEADITVHVFGVITI